MELGNHIYFTSTTSFNGILVSTIFRDFDKFILHFKLYKIKINDITLLKTIKQQCENNQFQQSILNKLDCEITAEHKMDYNSVELYCNTLKLTLPPLLNKYTDNEQLINYTINNKINIVLSIKQIQRLSNDIYSFYQNYFILETLFKLLIVSNDNTSSTTKKISNSISEYITKPSECVQEQSSSTIDIKSVDLETIDNIMYLCFNNVIRTFIIHISLSYYRFISNNSIKIEDDFKKLTIPSIFPTSYIFDSSYFRSIIMSLSTDQINMFDQYINKILLLLCNKEIIQNPLYLMMLNCLLFIYILRYILYTHPHEFLDRFQLWISTPSIQTKIINHHITIYRKQFIDKLSIEIMEPDISFDIESSINIKEISDKYHYLLSISESDFISNVFKDLDSKDLSTRHDFILNYPRVINLEQFKLNNKVNVHQELFINSEYELNNSILIENLLNYNFENKFLTNIYEELIKYTDDNSSILLINREKYPTSIVNLFDTLNRMLNTGIFKSDNVNTLRYYQILCDNLPDAKLLSHITILYIIYQIIIPFYYTTYKTTKFIDHLLI